MTASPDRSTVNLNGEEADADLLTSAAVCPIHHPLTNLLSRSQKQQEEQAKRQSEILLSQEDLLACISEAFGERFTAAAAPSAARTEASPEGQLFNPRTRQLIADSRLGATKEGATAPPAANGSRAEAMSFSRPSRTGHVTGGFGAVVGITALAKSFATKAKHRPSADISVSAPSGPSYRMGNHISESDLVAHHVDDGQSKGVYDHTAADSSPSALSETTPVVPMVKTAVLGRVLEDRQAQTDRLQHSVDELQRSVAEMQAMMMALLRQQQGTTSPSASRRTSPMLLVPSDE